MNLFFFFTAPGLSGTLSVFKFFFLRFLFAQERKTTGWHPFQRALAKPAGASSHPVPANVPAGLCFKPFIKPMLLQTEPERIFVIYNLLPKKSVWIVGITSNQYQYQININVFNVSTPSLRPMCFPLFIYLLSGDLHVGKKITLNFRCLHIILPRGFLWLLRTCGWCWNCCNTSEDRL